MNKICKGDEVIVVIGKDKGKCGVVLVVGVEYVMVEGINFVKKYVKLNLMKGMMGGVEVKMMFLYILNVVLVDVNGKVLCVGIKVEEGKKVCFLKMIGVVLSV